MRRQSRNRSRRAGVSRGNRADIFLLFRLGLTLAEEIYTPTGYLRRSYSNQNPLQGTPFIRFSSCLQPSRGSLLHHQVRPLTLSLLKTFCRPYCRKEETQNFVQTILQEGTTRRDHPLSPLSFPFPSRKTPPTSSRSSSLTDLIEEACFSEKSQKSWSDLLEDSRRHSRVSASQGRQMRSTTSLPCLSPLPPPNHHFQASFRIIVQCLACNLTVFFQVSSDYKERRWRREEQRKEGRSKLTF